MSLVGKTSEETTVVFAQRKRRNNQGDKDKMQEENLNGVVKNHPIRDANNVVKHQILFVTPKM